MRRDEIKEIQAKLQSLGFNPGPVDGSAGPLTRRAVADYMQGRDPPQGGAVDRTVLDRTVLDRTVLEQLRQESPPPISRPTQVVDSAPPVTPAGDGANLQRYYPQPNAPQPPVQQTYVPQSRVQQPYVQRAPERRSPDPLAAIREAGDRLGAWLNSIAH